MSKQKNLFKTKMVPAKPGSGKLWDEEFVVDDGQVTCLGMEFENDDARRAYFTEKLREKLKDPEFRKIEGFPIGEDEDILKLSDPPYYTACPNPWIVDFIAEWEADKRRGDTEKGRHKEINNSASPSTHISDSCHREPFAADVSEGKNDPIYNAHSYHTKVPHKAIMRYILHYTEPGDIVFDGFAGTGMTGVAAQMCGDREVVESLGYKVENDGTILQQEIDEDGKTSWVKFSKLGARRAVLNDLSPAATFIAYNYNTPVDVRSFEREAKRILKEVEEECGWMYRTLHTASFRTEERGLSNEWVEKLKSCNTAEKIRNLLSPQSSSLTTVNFAFGKINYTVWSDVFICPECAGEVVFWEAAVDKEAGKVKDKFPCPHCNAELTKRKMERAWVTKFDTYVETENGRRGDTVRQAKQVPVLINYSVEQASSRHSKRFEKTPDEFDLTLIEKIENSEILYWFPTDRMMEGKETRRNDKTGITHVHHFYTKRNLWVLAALRHRANQLKLPSLHYWLNSLEHGLGKRVKHGNYSFPMSVLSGTLYIPSMGRENNPLYFYETRRKKHIKVLSATFANNNPVTCQSTENLNSPNNSIDYIFIDPPFGSNLNYSELSFAWECWLRTKTNNKPEAIENSVQGKGPAEYRQLMTACFKEAYRVLKPGRWMTVEFSNTKASVWNSIQTALTEAGFLIANVSALDKQQGSFKAVTTPTAVKQDLVISAYKPNGGFKERFETEAQTEEGVWDFVRTHLKYLPVTKSGAGFQPANKNNTGKMPVLQFIPERDPRIIYDQVIAYYVRKGYNVPIDSQDFQLGLSQRFSERDGMYFLPEQVAEYDRKKMIGGGRAVQQSLFVSDESSAIEWLRNLLRDKPQSFQDINPKFMQEISGWNKHEKGLELSTLLEQNFLMYDGKGAIPPQIVSWMRRSSELRPVIEEEFKQQGITVTENLQLRTQNSVLITRATAHWYVPDPNKAGDLEKLREKALLKEFEEYKQAKKKLKMFRLEAVRAGFKKAWQERDYKVIITVAEKIPSKILEEDPKLLMWYDQAVTRRGDAEMWRHGDG